MNFQELCEKYGRRTVLEALTDIVIDTWDMETLLSFAAENLLELYYECDDKYIEEECEEMEYGDELEKKLEESRVV